MLEIHGKQFFQAHDSQRGEHLVALDRVAEFYRIGDAFYAQVVLVTGFSVRVIDLELLEQLKKHI